MVARARNEIHGRILEKIGVTKVVYPEQEMGERIGRYIAAQDFMDWIALSSEYSLVEMKMPAEWAGKTLIDLRLREQFGFNVVGMKTGDEMIMRFDPSQPLDPDQVLYVIGKNQNLEHFQD